eukprot:1160734-Pelagomonas_calceolata.AAC.5
MMHELTIALYEHWQQQGEGNLHRRVRQPPNTTHSSPRHFWQPARNEVFGEAQLLQVGRDLGKDVIGQDPLQAIVPKEPAL